MNIVKFALLGSLRIVLFGCLKVALCAYTLFLSDTVVGGTASEGNGQVGGIAFYEPEGTSNSNIG
jgi:hypothetical protein